MMVMGMIMKEDRRRLMYGSRFGGEVGDEKRREGKWAEEGGRSFRLELSCGWMM